MQHQLIPPARYAAPGPARAALRGTGQLPAWTAGALLALCLLMGLARGAHGAEEETERLLVVDPYVELRTGPGRSFPVFFTVARHEWIEIEMRHTDWYKVRTESGKEGWVDRLQLENTLTEAGGKKTFRDVMLEDYLKRRVEFGASWGHFSSEPVLKLWTSYNITDNLAAELTAGEVQGQYSGTNFWHLDLLIQPWSEHRVVPFFGIGVGRLNYVPNASLVGAIPANSNSANAMIGVQVHVTERLIVRADWAAYTSLLSASQTAQFHALTAGLAFFF